MSDQIYRENNSFQSDIMTVAEVARVLRVSTVWVRQHANNRQPHLPSIKLAKMVRFKRSDVEAFIESHCKPT